MPAMDRAGIYGFFSRLFVREVDDAFARVLEGPLTQQLLPELSGSDERTLTRDPVAREALWHEDFARLTMVHLIPYESFFVRDDAMLETGGANPVAQFYRACGVEADLEAGRVVGPDHLGVELEFVSFLCSREAGYAHDGSRALDLRRTERDFLCRHLLPWAPVYLLAVRRNARSMLYREGAEVLLDFLLADADQLAMEEPT